MKYFAIFEEDMTQKNYENYLGFLGVMEIQVASQPRANSVIPLTEKGIFPRKRILGLGQDENGKVQGWFGDDKPLWKERRGYLLQFPDHKPT